MSDFSDAVTNHFGMHGPPEPHHPYYMLLFFNSQGSEVDYDFCDIGGETFSDGIEKIKKMGRSIMKSHGYANFSFGPCELEDCVINTDSRAHLRRTNGL